MKIKNLFTAVALSSVILVSCDKNDEVLSSTPTSIAEYVSANYPDAKIIIVKYDPNDKEYEVKLSNGWELTFDRNYKLKDADL